MPDAPANPLNRWTVAVAGLVSLAVAMGIGRFAFTPLLPMMLHDGVVDLPRASLLASANYFGYLVGALLCMLQPLIWRRLPALPPFQGTQWLRGGLVATCLLTLGMAAPWPAGWPWLRFAAGVASALVFVQTSGWCLAQLARLQVPAMGGLIYVGPGLGIVLSGLSASGMVALGWSAAAGWVIFGLLAALLSAAIVRVFRTEAVPASAAPPAPVATPANATGHAMGKAMRPAGAAGPASEVGWLALAYGLAGFGYIVTATFLPVIARGALPGSPWLDLFWPLFGLGVVLGAITASRVSAHRDMRLLLTGCYLVQAVGIAISLWWPTLTGFALGSLLLGLPFTAITYFGLQEVRRLRPLSAPSYIGLLTALYGMGQIVGPPMVAVLLRGRHADAGFTLSLEIAASALLAGAAIYIGMFWRYPKMPPHPSRS